ncbi:class I SAM-dependent methyltransferase [Actinoplanes sp. RD1]|uniref:class I SAM-dependent methyltransferase n=1 Tax=Actinoplanes sp. RD1 TaxID=3064538 RepID=UPI0027406B13|nr:class I SAM-dependent methyltransferase [Actinoplanes sp. RD1]
MNLGRVFDEVPALYDRVRPGYPAELFADLPPLGDVLEIGCGTGQASRSLVARAGSLLALEPGPALAAHARARGLTVESSTFEDWDDRGRRFNTIVAAQSWHWVDPATGWRKAHDLLRPGGHLALLSHVVVRRPGEPEVYAETADLHEHFSPGDPSWGHPPLEESVLGTDQGWGPHFERPEVRWYPYVQWLSGADYADLMRTNSIYRRLDPAVREPLLDAVADRIRTRLGDRVPRRYLTHLRVGRRSNP